MGVDAHVSGSAGETLVLPVGDVLASLWVNVLLSQAKVNDIDDGLLLVRLTTNKKVLGLDVTIDELFLMDILNPG